MGPLALIGSHPLREEDALGAADMARRVLHLFEMGRLTGPAPTYQLWAGKLEERGHTLSFNAAALLRKKPSSSFELVVIEVDDVNEIRDTQQSSASFISCGRLEQEFTTDIKPSKKAAKMPNIQPLFIIQSANIVEVGVAITPTAITITMEASKADVALEEGDDTDVRDVESRSALLQFEFKPCTAAGQFAYFPLGRETYTKITLERALWVLCAMRAHGRGSATAAIDTVVPLFDGNAEAFTWLKSQLS